MQRIAIITAVLFSAVNAVAVPQQIGFKCNTGDAFTSHGHTCTLACGVDRPYGDLNLFTGYGFKECAFLCAQTDGCVAAVHEASDEKGNCWLKADLKPAVGSPDKVTFICPK